jgi:hypothetical protein
MDSKHEPNVSLHSIQYEDQFTNEEILYLSHKQKLVSQARNGVSAFILLSSIAIIATTANATATYHSSPTQVGWYLSVWPQNMDLRPTNAVIAVASILAAFNLVVLGLGALPSVRCDITISRLWIRS